MARLLGLNRSTCWRRVKGGEVLGALPVVEVAAHEDGTDRFGGLALLDDDGVELEPTVDWEDLIAVLDTEQPLPPAVFDKEASQRAGAVVRVDARGNDEAQSPAGFQQRVGGFEKELVQVDVRRSLVPERDVTGRRNPLYGRGPRATCREAHGSRSRVQW